jgi:peptidoglycan hydrolase-like protein with peptidoglycan-binding domain
MGGGWIGGRLAARGRVAGLGAIAAAVTAIVATGCVSGVASAAPSKPAVAAKPAASARPAAVAATTRRAAKATVDAPAAPAAYTPPKRDLSDGMSGADVKALQQRLAALKYYPGPTDGKFGSDTLEAVWAFQEVNGVPVTGVIDSATKKALVRPHAYKAKYPGQAGTRVEVNLGLGVLVFFKNHQIALVSHVSTGGHYFFCAGGTCNNYAETPTGEFNALYFVPGWDQGPLGAMYNPTFFNYSGYAIHGELNSEVPLAPVSHGCVRIPYDIASWFYKDLTITETPGKGTEVWIYNQWTTWNQG